MPPKKRFKKSPKISGKNPDLVILDERQLDLLEYAKTNQIPHITSRPIEISLEERLRLARAH